jgi:hypothetical protein
MMPTDLASLAWYSRFAVAATYSATALTGLVLIAGDDSGARMLCGWLIGSSVAMWCIVDSMRNRFVFPYGQWWLCLTPAMPLVVLDYIGKSRGSKGLRKAALHGSALFLINIAFAIVYFLLLD